MTTNRIPLSIIAFAVLGWIAAGVMLFTTTKAEFRAQLALHSAQTWQMYASVLNDRLVEYGDSSRADTLLLPPYSEDTCKLLTSVIDDQERSPCDGYRRYNSDAF